MNQRVNGLLREIQSLEKVLHAELARQHAGLRFGLERGRVRFEQEVLRRHRQLKTRLWRYIAHAHPLVVLTAPVIYALIVPLLLLDFFVTVYQAICFPIYGIEKARRRDFIVFDRYHLAYLNGLEKLNCAYCSYANGLINYTREIASRTERHWCPIKHARRAMGTHPLYASYPEYGDALAYKNWLKAYERKDKRRRKRR